MFFATTKLHDSNGINQDKVNHAMQILPEQCDLSCGELCTC